MPLAGLAMVWHVPSSLHMHPESSLAYTYHKGGAHNSYCRCRQVTTLHSTQSFGTRVLLGMLFKVVSYSCTAVAMHTGTHSQLVRHLFMSS